MEQTTYILQKKIDTPFVTIPVGTKYLKNGNEYRSDGILFNNDAEYYTSVFPVKQVEENKLWFKKEEPKQWRILCFGSSLGKFCKLRHDGLYSYDTHGGWELEVMLSDKSNKIKTVERLSDGEVFTVGDKVNCDKCPESFSRQTIDKFIIAEKGFMIASCAGVATSIKNISHAPKESPLPINDFVSGSKETIGNYILFGFDVMNVNGKNYVDKAAVEEWMATTQKKHISDQILEARKDTFYSAREMRIYDTVPKNNKYPTFESYIQSLNK